MQGSVLSPEKRSEVTEEIQETMDPKDSSTQDHKQPSSPVRVISVAGNIFSRIRDQSLGFVKWPVETVTTSLRNTGNIVLHVRDKSLGFVKWPLETMTTSLHGILSLGNKDHMFLRILDRCPECVRVQLESLPIRIWPFKYIGKHQKQIEHLKAIIEFSDARFYRVDVMLDPSTAHPRLDMSEDGKCVRDTGDVLRVPNSEERFDSHMFVLAKEGFVKGKRYWEVEVGQKKSWDLGVASESISRKGRITLAPQNGYWVIGLDGKKDYWARTDPWTHLQVSGKPAKIGIFLDMSAGHLSFYDVYRKSKLYTFTIKHSGKLYPFFSTGFLAESLDSHPLKVPPWLEEEEADSIVSGINNVYSI